MKCTETTLPGVLIFEPRVFGDERGFFLETFNVEKYRQFGITEDFVQDNLSFSGKGILRGLHYQKPKAQGKLVQVLQGEVLDVAVDIRRGSPTFGSWFSLVLSVENKKQLYVPPGFAHGFSVLSDTALFHYKCTDYYYPEGEQSIAWNDPELGIDWMVENPSLSAKDSAAPRLAEIPADRLPEFRP